MNPKQALAIFWSRRSIILLVFVAMLLSAFLALSFTRPQYSATAQLYVNLGDNSAISVGQVTVVAARSYLTTQIEALRSRSTALAVVEYEKLADDPDWQARFRSSAEGEMEFGEWAAAVLLRQLEVVRVGASDIIAIGFRSESPAFAARMANAFADGFLRRDIEMRAGPSQIAIRWLEDRLQVLRENIAAVEAERSRLRLEAIRRGDADATTGTPEAFSSLQSVIANARNGVIQATAALEMARSGQNPATDNSELLGLRRQLSDVNLALQRETPLLGPTHRRIAGLRSNAEALQGQIDRAATRIRSEMVAERERELAAAEKRLEEATVLMSRDESQRHDQSRSRASAIALDREIESLRGQIDALVQRRERATSEAAATMTNMSVMTRASVPTSPNWPRVPLVLALAAAMGIAFGFALAFLREMFDRRVRCQDDLTAYFDAPVLGKIKGRVLSRKMAALPPVPDRPMQWVRRRAPWMIEETLTRA